MTPERVRFTSHPRSFRVLATSCADPTCPCGEVTFHLVEIVELGTPADRRLRLDIRVDPATWQEVQAPARSQASAAWVQEFLRDYPPAERLVLQQAALQKQQRARHLRDHRFDAEALAGHRLVSFDEIVAESGATGRTEFLGHLEYEGKAYLIGDLYCANPQCPCAEVHLEFFSLTPPDTPEGAAVAASHFLARVSLGGDVQIEEATACSEAQARAIAQAWWVEHREVLKDLRWRYETIKEIGRRSLPSAQIGPATAIPRPAEPATHNGRPGRNDPCPCGSGKKYKKCCGR